MIEKLEHSYEAVAQQIFDVFQKSYQVEASLIGIEEFPPLLRSSRDIETSGSQFFGYSTGGTLAGVIEVVIENRRLEICSLTVDPLFFRKGIAGKLISYVLEYSNCEEAVVETAVANTPAITLYIKLGFVEYRRWKTSQGIDKLALLQGVNKS